MTTNDNVFESTEMFKIGLSVSNPDVHIGIIPSANITIVDNEGTVLYSESLSTLYT